ncbi:MAG TPA: penicillin-binding protein 2 [Candidatus Moranbacteria bacterium]|nr:penicillin-binding protein 2 [Candidatus Moranbacteria bacterium]
MAETTKNRKYKIGSRCNLAQKTDENLGDARIYFLTFFVLAIAAAIFFKLYFLQVISHSQYKALAEEQHSLFKKLIPKRGEIFLRDREGLYPVAVNREVKMAYAVPKEVEDAEKTSYVVAETLGLDRGELYEKLSRPEDMYEVLKHRLSDEETDKINQSKLKGIHLADETYRYYPAGELASHVLGFVGWKDEIFGGRYGLELFFEDKLKGQEGNLFHQKDNSGRWITFKEKEISYARDGDTLVLTIDHIIQYETEKIIKSAVEKHQADKGTIIVMESNSGKILALASYPNFNPNDYASVENMETFRNLAVSDAYEPGSIFKTFTLASAIDAGKITPNTTYTDTGVVKEAGYTMKNSDLKSYGVQTMTQVLEKSLNTGVIFAEKQLGNRNFADYVKRFGFGEPTGVDLFGEAAGNINNLKNLKSDIQFFTSAFGQGITTTPIQLISGYNVIANGGVLLKPQTVEKIIHSDGSEEVTNPMEIRRVISAQTAYQAKQMLKSVVVEGHGKRAGVPGYLVGGKTGTAQVASSNSRGYEEGKTIGSFAGFAPVDNPKFTVLVRIDDPKDVEWAESSAAPAFGELMKFLLEYGNVEPTEKYTQKDIDTFNATHTLKDFFIKKEDEDKDNNESKKDNE